ncbi:hypothetical protein [Apibacter sp. HY039]|uniref:hypothetical protein n=1 Tax=Apibacter sp. HY039 TaxID=2501476 RepID=UPI0013E308BC|nr:hypothetical protein [Apibacter sp. HY039]
MIRIKEKRNYFFWITWKNFDKKEKADEEDYHVIYELFYKTNLLKKMIGIDRIILLLASLPWIILMVGLLCIVGIFYYIFFMI